MNGGIKSCLSYSKYKNNVCVVRVGKGKGCPLCQLYTASWAKFFLEYTIYFC